MQYSLHRLRTQHQLMFRPSTNLGWFCMRSFFGMNNGTEKCPVGFIRTSTAKTPCTRCFNTALWSILWHSLSWYWTKVSVVWLSVQPLIANPHSTLMLVLFDCYGDHVLRRTPSVGHPHGYTTMFHVFPKQKKWGDSTNSSPIVCKLARSWKYTCVSAQCPILNVRRRCPYINCWSMMTCSCASFVGHFKLNQLMKNLRMCGATWQRANGRAAAVASGSAPMVVTCTCFTSSFHCCPIKINFTGNQCLTVLEQWYWSVQDNSGRGMVHR